MPESPERPEPTKARRNLENLIKRTITSRYDTCLAKLVRNMRALADEVEREGEPRKRYGSDSDQVNYPEAAQRVVHTLLWALANLNVGNLLDSANEAHDVAHDIL